MTRVTVIGSLPPPFNGQNVQTQRSASLLSCHFHVDTINQSTGREALNDELSVAARIKHYLAQRSLIRQAFADVPGNNPPDAVIWHTVSPAHLGHIRDMLVVLPSLPRSIPLYAVVHWGNFDRVFRQRTTAITARRLVDRVSGFVFLDKALADRCARWVPAEKRLVVPNSIDEALIPSSAAVQSKVAGAIPDVPMILFVANMIASKGYMELVGGLHELARREVRFRATFAGKWQSSADRIAFERAVKENRLDDRVTHLGAVTDRQTVAELYLNACVFALPTYYPTEAQPLSVIEALAAATPVVVSRHASLPNMVRDGHEARFVDPHSPTEIADAIEQLLESATWRDAAAAARLRFDKKFAPDVVAEQWRVILDQT